VRIADVRVVLVDRIALRLFERANLEAFTLE